MHVVAIYDTAPSDGSLAPALAKAMGLHAMDVRHRVMSPGPCIVAVHNDADAASELCMRLNAADFPAFVRDVPAVQGSPVWVPVRSFTMDSSGIDWRPPGRGDAFRMAWEDIHLVVRGTRVAVTETSETIERKSFSMARAVATGGLVRKKKVKVEQSRTEQQREGFIHVYSAAGKIAVIGEQSFDYKGLGGLLEHSRAANFIALLKLIRQRAASATLDDRLLTHAGQTTLLSGRLDTQEHIKLASALIAGALHLKQRAPR